MKVCTALGVEKGGLDERLLEGVKRAGDTRVEVTRLIEKITALEVTSSSPADDSPA